MEMIHKKAVPDYGEGGDGAVGRGECEQKQKDDFYRTALNICLSFLNEVKNLGKEYGC